MDQISLFVGYVTPWALIIGGYIAMFVGWARHEEADDFIEELGTSFPRLCVGVGFGIFAAGFIVDGSTNMFLVVVLVIAAVSHVIAGIMRIINAIDAWA